MARYCCLVQEFVIRAFNFVAQVADGTFTTPRLTPFDTMGSSSGLMAYAVGAVR